MLSPIVTKDMQLFKGSNRLAPTNRNNLKNVRARARSLNEVSSQSGKSHISVPVTRSVSVGGHRPPSSMSEGNLPVAAATAPKTKSASPPRFSVRKVTLDPIVEGVEMGREGHHQRQNGNGRLSGRRQRQTTQSSSSSAPESSATPAPPAKKTGVLGWLSKTFGKKNREEGQGTSKEDREEISSDRRGSGKENEPSSSKRESPRKEDEGGR